jgi:hypothetical protein
LSFSRSRTRLDVAFHRHHSGQLVEFTFPPVRSRTTDAALGREPGIGLRSTIGAKSMGDESWRDQATVIIRRFLAGEDDAIGQYADRYNAELVRAATSLIRCDGIAEADLDGQEAVNIALYRLFRARDRGTLAAIEDSEQLLKVLLTILRRVVGEAKERCRRIKRRADVSRAGANGGHAGGDGEAGGTGKGLLRIEADLDLFCCDLPPTESSVLAEEELETFLDFLEDSTLQTILRMRYPGYLSHEIARCLKQSTRTIERKLNVIGYAYARFKRRHG